ncbi:MAG TPA: sigma-70 family RNA polymerase sigma factor [Gemmatimonadaceae bacterium]|nr:sigma-70 family RNA polymerase sigma factor [Gemmatimonadaceae bacterium]
MSGAAGDPSNDPVTAALARVLEARDAAATDVAWRGFVDASSTLLLQVARSTATNRDAAMDAYTFVLEQLREHDCRRLRTYIGRDGTRFSTWLLVVARRLCIDFHRRRYGRPQSAAGADPQAALERATRRRLIDLAAEEIDPDTISDARTRGPEAELRFAQLRRALATALDALEPSDKLLLTMRFEDERSAAEIARAMGFPTPFHVYRRLTRVLDGLRATLQERGIHDPTP